MFENKVILISVDGMRPDGFLTCGNPYIHEMMAKSFYTLDGQTVLPSMTLPSWALPRISASRSGT